MDTITPGDELVFDVFAALAEFERDLPRADRPRGWPPPEPAATAAAGGR
jgi:DNA invertase Pin-like site-specific DNA recombinase